MGYNPSAAKMASKNMMNHYGRKQQFHTYGIDIAYIFGKSDTLKPSR
jgi:hypothetical protein